MTKLTTLDLAPFYRSSVGLDRLFDRITDQLDSASGNYPPYDIIRVRDDVYEIRIAAAGFQQNEIEVEFHEGRLSIYSNREQQPQPEYEYLHHGISNRSWIRTFTLADYVEVKSARMQDGILTVRLERIIPEAMKPKKIAIEYSTVAAQ